MLDYFTQQYEMVCTRLDYDMADLIQLHEIIREQLAFDNKFSDNEKKILVFYYFEDLTFKELGEILDITESQVSLLHTNALLKLSSGLKNNRKEIVEKLLAKHQSLEPNR